jgi:hypothetical protein
MQAKAGVVVSLFALSSALPLPAQGAPPPIPVELRQRFGFDGPVVAKIGDGIGNLQVGDLDGDGKLEAIVADGRRARLAVVRVTGDASAVDAVPTQGQIGGYRLADVHGDGKSDLLLIDTRGRLQVRHPGGGKSDTPIDLGLGNRVGLLAGDLDGDGKQDLVAIGRTQMRWLTKVADGARLSPVEPLEENAHSYELLDIDGDRHLDLACVVPGAAMNLRLRRGHGDGTFGPWRIVSIDNLRHIMPTRTASGAPALGTIEGPHRRVALQQFTDRGGAAALEWWALGESQAAKSLPFAVGDLDNDGDEDLVLVQGDRAQLQFFEWRGDTFVPQALPTLAGVTSIAIGDVDGDGKQDLVLASAEEDALSWKSGALPLTQFPVQLTTVDKPVAAAVAPGGGVLVICRTEKREAHLDRVRPDAAPERLADLGRIAADPSRLLVADIGDGPGLEVVFVVPNEGLRSVTLGTVQGGPAHGKPGDAAGFTKKLDDGALAVCTHEGAAALLAVRERFVRRFRLDVKGQVQVLAQDNGPDGIAELGLAALLPGGGSLYLDKKSNKLVRTLPNAAPASIDVPGFDFSHLIAHRDAAVLVGPRGVLRVPFGTGPSLEAVASHEPPNDRTHYWHGLSGDFDGDGVRDLALIDGHLPGVQILAGGKDGLQRALAMPVFETPPSQEPENEPRELAVGDLNGDGRDDLVVLAHDRLLIYLQQK